MFIMSGLCVCNCYFGLVIAVSLAPRAFLEILCRRYAQIFLSEARLLPDEVSLSNSDSNGCVE